MTMFNESLLVAMKNMINDNEWLTEKAERVIRYEEVEKSGGYCETCYYEWTDVEIYYVTSTGKEIKYEYSGDFGDLIRTLAKY